MGYSYIYIYSLYMSLYSYIYIYILMINSGYCFDVLFLVDRLIFRDPWSNRWTFCTRVPNV